MPNDLSWMERLRGKRTHDINLPQEGPKDPRLAGLADHLKNILGAVKDVSNKEDPIKGLQDAGKRFKQSQKDAIMEEFGR